MAVDKFTQMKLVTKDSGVLFRNVPRPQWSCLRCTSDVFLLKIIFIKWIFGYLAVETKF